MSGSRIRESAEQGREERLDEAVEQTFPASDPPANTPPAGSRKAEKEGQAKAGSDRTRAQDPHGMKPASAAGEDEPKGAPTSDRHEMETAAGEKAQRGGGQGAP